MTNQLEKKLYKLQEDIVNIKNELKDFKIEFKSRGKNHDKNAETFKELAAENNKLHDANHKLISELNQVKTDQAVHKVLLTEFTEITKDLQKDIRGLGDKIVIEIGRVEKSIQTNTRWIFKVLAGCLTLVCTVVPIIILLIK